MISRQEAIDKFREILGDTTAWITLKRSQFVHHLSVFQSWSLRDALWKIERARQEAFLSTALNNSSLLAFTEDREYIPRWPVSATGTIEIENQGIHAVSIPQNQALDSNEVPYTTDDAVIVEPLGTAQVDITQREKIELDSHTVTEEKSFYEILIPVEYARLINGISVYADIDDGEGLTLWTHSHLFQNAGEDSKIYDIFYSHADQVGIRFGNGIFGVKPPLGSTVDIVLWITQGDTYLAANQKVDVVGDVLDYAEQPAKLEIMTVTAIDDGHLQESGEELRRNLHYWPIYNERFIWKEDYAFYLNRHIPGIIWRNIWGEKEAEGALGELRLDHINTIFISAYKPGETTLGQQIIDEMEQAKIYNRRFKWVEPVFATFGLTVQCLIPRVYSASTVEQAILDTLELHYGKDSTSRLDTFYINDVYRVISATGYFKEVKANFSVEHTGRIQAAALNEMLHIDMNATTVQVDYL